MRTNRLLWAIALSFSACEVHVGEGDFDGSFWEDDNDASITGFDMPAPVRRRDAGSSTMNTDEDGGVSSGPTDAGKTVDSGLMSPDDPSQTVTAKDVAGYLARGMCEALESCVGEERAALALRGNDCVEFTTRQLADRQLHWLGQSVASRRVVFDPSRLSACQRDIAAFGCDVKLRRLPASCGSALEGRQDIDDNCSIDFDCGNRAYCDKGSLETCPGRCAEFQRSGLPCDASSQCADGLLCRDGVCKLPRGEGDSCTTRFGNECQDGLVCQGKSGGLTCQKLQAIYVGKANESCDRFGKLCSEGLVCRSQNSTSSVGVCAPKAAADAACRASEPSQCPVAQYCKDKQSQRPVSGGVDGVCADRPGEGQSCGSSGSVPDCAPGFACVGDPPTCRGLQSAGASCVSNAQCYGGLCQAGTCAVTTILCQ